MGKGELFEKQRQMLLQTKDFSVLSEREHEILKMRFGLNDSEEHVRREIGEQFGVSATRIHQLEARALHRLGIPYEVPKDDYGRELVKCVRCGRWLPRSQTVQDIKGHEGECDICHYEDMGADVSNYKMEEEELIQHLVNAYYSGERASGVGIVYTVRNKMFSMDIRGENHFLSKNALADNKGDELAAKIATWAK